MDQALLAEVYFMTEAEKTQATETIAAASRFLLEMPTHVVSSVGFERCGLYVTRKITISLRDKGFMLITIMMPEENNKTNNPADTMDPGWV